jgi:hypothetical protein
MPHSFLPRYREMVLAQLRDEGSVIKLAETDHEPTMSKSVSSSGSSSISM